MVNLKDIAEKAGTSIATVSIALHGAQGRKRVSDKRVKLIQDIAAKLNYRPNSAARAMALNKTCQIGVLLRNAPDRPINNPANFEIVLGIGEYLSSNGYVQVLVPLRSIEEEINQSTRIFSERLLDGIIVVDAHSSNLYKFVKKTFHHALFLETNYWNNHLCLRRDERQAAFKAASEIKAAGYRKIMYVGGVRSPSKHYSVSERYEGVMEALGKDVDVKILETRVMDELVPLLPSMFEPGMGVICDGNMNARHLYTHLAQSGLIPPRDYGLVCCDDSHETERTFPMLSRVSFNRYEMGKLAARMLIESLRSPKSPPKSMRIAGMWIPGETIRAQ
ncbi:MAG: LacI family DNA-binding transcriptional regulator [Victivallales bacterium]|jgi:LacI family transcriptional regulator